MKNSKLHACFPVLIFMLFALFGCELNEEVIRRENDTNKINIREASLEKLLRENKFANAYNTVYANREKSRTVMEGQYNFTIVPHGAKVIEDGSKTSYTFKITREISNPDYFENLVINVDSLGQPSAYVLKYTPSEPLSLSAHGSFAFKGQVKITPIVYNASEMDKTTICVTAQILMCDQAWSPDNTGVHVATNECNDQNHLFYSPVTTCYTTNGDIGGGGDGDPGVTVPIGDDGGGSGGGGGDGDPSTGGGLTPPNHCPRCPVFVTTPVEEMAPVITSESCEKLGNLLKQKRVKAGLNYLKNNLQTNLETVYSLEHDVSNNSVSLRPGASGIRSGIVRIFPTTFGAVHNHPIKLEDEDSSFPMFSVDDLLTPYQIAMSGGVQPVEYPLTNIMVAPDNTYALIPNDEQALSILTSKFASEKSFRDFTSELRDLYIAVGKPWNVDQNTLAREFLKFVNDKYNLNISLYQMSNADFYNNSNA